MGRFRILSISCVLSAVLLLLLAEVQLRAAMAQQVSPDELDDEPTCSLDPSAKSDCGGAAASDASGEAASAQNLQDLTRRVVSLTDETFDELTLTPTPATWLVMFETSACPLCKKAVPALEGLSVDADILDHNDRELEAMRNLQVVAARKEEEDDKTPKGPVYVYEESADDGEVPRGPVYVATVDAGWSGRDTTKRFEVDATPTIIVVRNEGHGDESAGDDPRSYYVYRGQRATYPLRGFVLGGYRMRKRAEMPPPLPEDERKPHSYSGRFYEYVLSPGARWAGGIVGKFLVAWVVFMGGLGLFMRVHNYAWGENADDDYGEKRREEIEREKAEGRRELKEETADERSARRQRAMWERKAENRAKFALARERKKRETGGDEVGGDDDDDDEGVGFAVKKSDVQNSSSSDGKKVGKSKDS